ncbi:MAG: ATP synthase F1 subunit delta [Chloroflexi bacterium]|nr:ATP synthase F1 subunit delta [Chloroflexota bacterium]
MAKRASARRYAQAVFQLASSDDDRERWLQDLTLIASALENAEFAEFLDAPQVTARQKVEVIRSTLGDRVDGLALNLLGLLASRSNAQYIPDIAEQYQAMLDRYRGIERGEVVSAVPLDNEQYGKVTEMLRGIVGKEVRLSSRVEPAILGGIVARVGDRVIDGSTRTRLQEMRRELARRA